MKCHSCKNLLNLTYHKKSRFRKKGEDLLFKSHLVHFDSDNNGVNMCIDYFYCLSCLSFYKQIFSSDEDSCVQLEEFTSSSKEHVEHIKKQLSRYLFLQNELEQFKQQTNIKSNRIVTVYHMISGRAYSNGISEVDKIKKFGFLPNQYNSCNGMELSLDQLFSNHDFHEHYAPYATFIKFNIKMKDLYFKVSYGYHQPYIELSTNRLIKSDDITVIFPFEEKDDIKLTDYIFEERKNVSDFHQKFKSYREELMKESNFEEKVQIYLDNIKLDIEPDLMDLLSEEEIEKLRRDMEKILAKYNK